MQKEKFSHFIEEMEKANVKVSIKDSKFITVRCSYACKPTVENAKKCRESLNMIRAEVDKCVSKLLEQFPDVCGLDLCL